MHYPNALPPAKFDTTLVMCIVKSMSSAWVKVAENIVRHEPSGTLYLRAKVGGKPIRRSLGVSALRPAKIKRDQMLSELRAMAGNFSDDTLTMDDALNYTLAWYVGRPSHEQTKSSLVYRRQLIKVLRRTFPLSSPRLWTRDVMEKWWTDPEITRYAATRRNGMLDTVRKMFDLLIERGIRSDDPSSRLKRVPVRPEVPEVPSRADFERVLENVEDQNSDFAVESASFIAFMAFSGARVGEARNVTWADIGKTHITITGGADGTKNKEVRQVPIIAPMRELLEAMYYDGAAGRLFSIHSPRFALSGACRRLGLPHYTPHTMRHLFATTSIESGVPIPTVARWLGHKDGGALLMRVYGHLRDQHSLEQAAKVDFKA